jgi:PAS domain-containing protein
MSPPEESSESSPEKKEPLSKGGVPEHTSPPVTHDLSSLGLDRYARAIGEILTILRDVDSCSTVDEIRQKIADKARIISDSQRAEIALWDESRKALRIWAQSGVAPTLNCMLGRDVKEGGMIMQAWKQQGKPKLVFSNDLHPDIDYIMADERTKAEAAIRLQYRGRPIGVLNVEWFEPTYSRDIPSDEIFELLADYASIAIMIIERESSFRGLAGGLSSASDISEAVCKGLKKIYSDYGFSSALLFEVNHKHDRLEVNYLMEQNHARITQHEVDRWVWNLKEESFAREVFNSPVGLWEQDAETSTLLNPAGRQKFGIVGPIVGIPLRHEGVAVGALVIWGGVAENSSPKCLEDLRPIASLLASYLSPEHHTKKALHPYVLLTNLLRNAQADVGLLQTIERILKTILGWGFDRARYLKYSDGKPNKPDVFVRELQLEATATGEPTKNTERVFIKVDDMPHAKIVRDHFLKAEFERARIFSPDKDGIDPGYGQWEKEQDTPWIVAPIFIHGRLMGQLCADNVKSKLPIPDSARDFLTLAAHIAAKILDRLTRVHSLEGAESSIGMFRKDRASRFKWVNDVFVLDVAKSRPHLNLNDSSEKALKLDKACERINQAFSKTKRADRRDIEALRDLIIDSTDVDIFGSGPLAEKYTRRDRLVMGFDEIEEKYFDEKARCMRWPREPNRDGRRYRLVETVKAPILDHNGRPVGVEGYYIADPLERSLIFQGSNIGIFQSSKEGKGGKEGKYIYVNDALAKMLGFKNKNDERIYELNIPTQVYQSNKDREEFIKQVENNRAISNFEYRMLCPGLGDGKASIKVAEYAWAVFDDEAEAHGSEVKYYEGIIRDISGQIQTSATLSEQDEAELSQEIAQEIAHDVANPLQVVGLGASAEMDTATHAENSREVKANLIRQALEQADEVLTGYCLGTRDGMGGYAEVNQVITIQLHSFAPEFQKAGFEEPKFEGEETKNIKVIIPKVRLRQILRNFMRNTLQAADRNWIEHPLTLLVETKLVVGTDGINHRVHITYTDTAGGMSQEKAANLFRRPEALPPQPKSQSGEHRRSIGMLNVAKHLDRYQCDEPIVTTIPGTGTKFEFSIPVANP